MVEPVVRGLVGVVDVDGGPTEAQVAVLRAIAVHLWERPDLDPAVVVPLGPAETAAALTDDETRRRFHEVMFAVEMCRHPMTDTQVSRVEEYAAALGVDGSDIVMFRDLVDQGVARAAADFARFFDEMIPARAEPSLRAMTEHEPAPDPELVARLDALHDLPDGTLGWTFVEFYRRNGIALPGSEGSALDPLYVAHDMIHVITGIAPTGEGEIALGGFQVAMKDTPANSFAFLSPLIVHEAGFAGIDTVEKTAGTLSRPYAAELLGRSLARGAATTGDFAFVDHFELAPLPLEEVRARYGVPPPADPGDGHHIFWERAVA
jgi:ubiquinone biosynthesis protein Coq4